MSITVSDHSVTTRLPDFLIVGEMRCGSTTLWEMLDRHPRVYFSQEKELHFFDDRDGRWGRGLEWYKEHFAGCKPDVLCGEATPDYLFYEGACERIAKTIPKAKLLAILRNPVDRAWSHYWHNVRRGRETLRFADALKAEPSRAASKDPDVRSHFSYASRGHYVRRLKVFEEFFGKNALCVVFLEELKTEAEAVTLRICEHLGLEFKRGMLINSLPRRNQSKYPRWPRFNAFSQKLMNPIKGRWYMKMPIQFIAAFTRPLRTYSGQARMDPEIREQLRAAYRSSDQQLEQWMGRAVPWVKEKE